MFRLLEVNKFIVRCENNLRTKNLPNCTIGGSAWSRSCTNGYRRRNYSIDAKSKTHSISIPAPKKTPIKTDVTNVIGASVKPKITDVKVTRKGGLHHIALGMDNLLSSRLLEPPEITLPTTTHEKFTVNNALLDNIRKSLEEFLQQNGRDFEKSDSSGFRSVTPAQGIKTNEIEAVSAEATPVQIDSIKPQRGQQKNKKKTPELANIELAGFEEEKRIKKNTGKVESYVNAATYADMPITSLYVLTWYLGGKHKGSYKICESHIKLYVDLLEQYASNGQWDKIQGLLRTMNTANVTLTPQVYMILLDCLGLGLPQSGSNTKLIGSSIEQAKNQGISLNDIMNNATFIRNQRENVLGAIRRVESNFHAVYTPPQLHYSNKLLSAHNIDIQPIEKTPYEMMNDSVKSADAKHSLDKAQLEKFIDEQFDIEHKMQIEVKNITITDKCVNDDVRRHRKLLDEMFKQWEQDLLQFFDHRLTVLCREMHRELPKNMNTYPYLKLLPPKDYVAIMMNQLRVVLDGSESFSLACGQLASEMGRQVLQRYQMRSREKNGITEKIRQNYKTYVDIYSSEKCSDLPRQLWQRITHHTQHDGASIGNTQKITWPYDIQTSIGDVLLNILLDDLKFDASVANAKKESGSSSKKVLYVIYRNRELKVRREVRMHQKLKQVYDRAKTDILLFNTNEIPMVCYPMPWLSSNYGGYLSTESTLMRLPLGEEEILVDKVPEPQLYPSLDALNQLGALPWRINTRILDLAIHIFNLGGDEKLNIPLTPDENLKNEHLRYRRMTRDEFNAIDRSSKSYQTNQNEINSLYCDTLYKLSLSNHYRDRVFWLPHNMDFRGRVYPIPPHLTHISADLSRSMLCFHRKQPLGEYGLDRLKVHCVNLTGNKKRVSIAERLAYANDIIDDIIDSADRPLDGKRWWLDSDDPWQTLATCMEITDAIRSPNPQEFLSNLPVHQDGSCNGLQHYAALGRDAEGAASVNLGVSERPQDVYSTVAEHVEKIRQMHANGMSSSNEDNIQKHAAIAKTLAGYIDRKVVKQTVMTSVYGVTPHGAMLQIKKQLMLSDFPPSDLNKAATYLSKITMEGLTEMCTAAREIQTWLTTVAKHASKHDHIRWVTPLDLPVIQPYTAKPPKRSSKQRTSFAPNFVHSLDSSHMMLTALNCDKAGLTFVSVHDCFWTHANKVPLMSQICREQFVLLHSQPILEDLARSFSEQDFNDEDLNKILERYPRQGDFDLKKVLQSVYFFS